MLDKILKSIDEKKNIFLTGGAGVGKSYTITKVVKHYTSKNKKIVKLASTGMAATAIGGQTLHSFLKIGIANSLQMLQKKGDFEPDQTLKTLISALDIVIIDEVSMISSGVMDIIKLRLAQSGFTGVLMVVGDFLQLPPIFKKDQIQEFAQKYPFIEEKKVFGYAWESDAWEYFSFANYELKEIKRTSDVVFMQVLNDIRHGCFLPQHERYFSKMLKQKPDNLEEYTYLFARNNQVISYNSQQIKVMEGNIFTLKAVIHEKVKNVKEEEVERFILESRLMSNLELKIGVPILFLRNSWNYYNGEKGYIKEIDEKNGIIHIKKEDGFIVKLERDNFLKKEWVESKKKDEIIMKETTRLWIKQFPITLAYGLTIHKSQGMSLDKLIIDANGIFSPSQFYVAISRAIDPSHLILDVSLHRLKNLIHVDQKIIKYYSEILLQ